MGLDIKMAVSQIRTYCFIEINTYTYIMFRLHKFDSQLQCTVELNNSAERLALRKVPRLLNCFNATHRYPPVLWYCNYLYLDFDSAYNNSWYSLTYNNIYNYYFYTLIYNKEVHTFCLSIGLWIPVEYY